MTPDPDRARSGYITERHEHYHHTPQSDQALTWAIAWAVVTLSSALAYWLIK